MFDDVPKAESGRSRSINSHVDLVPDETFARQPYVAQEQRKRAKIHS